MRKILIFIFVSVILFLFTLSSNINAAGEKSEIQIARDNANIFILTKGLYINSEWDDVILQNGPVCYDLQGNIIGYLFFVVKNKISIGYILIGSSLYHFDVLEAASEEFQNIPSSNEVKAVFANANKYKPKIVYAGYRRYYALYNIGDEKIAINLSSHELVNTNDLITDLVAPNQYRKDSIIYNTGNTTLSTIVSIPVPKECMWDSNLPPEQRNNNNCGPTTGAMIAEYWKYYRNYTYLPGWWADETGLYNTMYCNNWAPFFHGVPPWLFGPGFVNWAEAYGYPNFITDWNINRDFSIIAGEINANRPLGVMFSYTSQYTDWHWCAIKGYDNDGIVYFNDPWNYSAGINWNAVKVSSVISRIWR